MMQPTVNCFISEMLSVRFQIFVLYLQYLCNTIQSFVFVHILINQRAMKGIFCFPYSGVLLVCPISKSSEGVEAIFSQVIKILGSSTSVALFFLDQLGKKDWNFWSERSELKPPLELS